MSFLVSRERFSSLTNNSYEQCCVTQRSFAALKAAVLLPEQTGSAAKQQQDLNIEAMFSSDCLLPLVWPTEQAASCQACNHPLMQYRLGEHWHACESNWIPAAVEAHPVEAHRQGKLSLDAYGARVRVVPAHTRILRLRWLLGNALHKCNTAQRN